MVALSASSGTGNRDTVAIDNFSLTWSGTVVAPAVPQYWDLNGRSTTGIGGAAGTWDTVSSFWNAASDGGSSTGGPTAYNAGSIAVFGGTARHCRGRCIWRLRRMQEFSSPPTPTQSTVRDQLLLGATQLQRLPRQTLQPSTPEFPERPAWQRPARALSCSTASSNYTGGTTISGGQVVISTGLGAWRSVRPAHAEWRYPHHRRLHRRSPAFRHARARAAIDTGASRLTLPSTSNAGLTKFGNGKLTLTGFGQRLAGGRYCQRRHTSLGKWPSRRNRCSSRLPPQRASNSATPP